MDEVTLARLARRYSKEAIAALVLAMRDADDLRIKVTAALGLLDRAYGRPAQGNRPAAEYTLTQEDIAVMIADMERELGMGPGGADPTTAQKGRGEGDGEAEAPPAAIPIAGAASRTSDRLRRGTG